MTDPPHITDHVPPAAGTRESYHAEPNYCPVCSLELPAGYMRHPACDPALAPGTKQHNGTGKRLAHMSGRMVDGDNDSRAATGVLVTLTAATCRIEKGFDHE